MQVPGGLIYKSQLKQVGCTLTLYHRISNFNCSTRLPVYGPNESIIAI